MTNGIDQYDLRYCIVFFLFVGLRKLSPTYGVVDAYARRAPNKNGLILLDLKGRGIILSEYHNSLGY
ncbi:hypothetical protein [Coxiella burnetii]|uniref:hypothetical protein n=1 Tax=Coxiella burnetii TaxID=777 RepID=UPI00217616AF|nr:hypothetical protein [Coxiella burnetii]